MSRFPCLPCGWAPDPGGYGSDQESTQDRIYPGPEAGSERLRRVINKGITEEDLLATCRDAFALGWKVMKFYFMIGLPTETVEDIDAITELAMKAKKRATRVAVAVARSM